MSEYVASVTVASVLCALISLISYGKDGDRTVKSAVAMILLYTVSSPIISLISGLGEISYSDFYPDVPPYAENGEGEYLQVARDSFCEGIKSLVSEKFGVEKESVSVRIFDFDFENMRAGKIKIILSGRAAFLDARLVDSLIEESGLGECEVDIEIS